MWTSLKGLFEIFTVCAEWLEMAGVSAAQIDTLTSCSAALLLVFLLICVAGIALKLTKVVREKKHPNPVGAVLGRIILALGSMIGIPAILAIVFGVKSQFNLILSFYTPFSEASQLEILINIAGIFALVMIGVLLFSFVSYLINETQKAVERYKWWGIFEMISAFIYGFMIMILLVSVLLNAIHLVEFDYTPFRNWFLIGTVLYILNECSSQLDRRRRGRLGNKNSIGYLVEAGDKEGEDDGSTKRIAVITPEVEQRIVEEAAAATMAKVNEAEETKEDSPNESVDETDDIVSEEDAKSVTEEPAEKAEETVEIVEEEDNNTEESSEETSEVTEEESESEGEEAEESEESSEESVEEKKDHSSEE